MESQGTRGPVTEEVRCVGSPRTTPRSDLTYSLWALFCTVQHTSTGVSVNFRIILNYLYRSKRDPEGSTF